MKTDCLNAKQKLRDGGYTCVLCRGEAVLTSTERGVKPLLELFDSQTDTEGFCAADKVVGRAAAFLYALLRVEEVYAPVMSEGALDIFRQYGITAFYDVTAKVISNRDHSGICPMEQATENAAVAQEALLLIRERLRQLSAGQ